MILSKIINGGRNNDLTDQKKQPHTNNLDIILLAFFLVSMASMTIPLRIVAGPSNNNSNSSINAISTATSLQLAYAQPSQDNNTITAHLGKPFQLRINQTAIIMPDNMSIRFLDVLEDSRCPTTVVCVWAGQVTISLNVTELDPGFPSILNLALGLSSSADVDSHIVELFEVEPYPMMDGIIPKGDYRANLMALPS